MILTAPGGVTLTWRGQAGFALQGKRDNSPRRPLFQRDDRRIPPPLDPRQLSNVDLLLCTHEHWDHFDAPAVAAIAQASPQAYPHTASSALAHETLTDLPVRVIPVPACHGVEVADAYNFGNDLSDGQVRYLGYVLDFAGVRVYHAGDTLWWPGQEDALRDLAVNVALLPINGRDPHREADNIVSNRGTNARPS